MKYCIIVDGYSAGKQLTRELVKMGYKCIHIQSNPLIKKTYALHEVQYYEASLSFLGSIAELINEIRIVTNAGTIECVISGSEPGVELADLLSEALKLTTTNGTKLSKARRNKYEMRKALAAADLATPVFFESGDLNEIIEWVSHSTSYPVVAKPLNSACTDGVAICNNSEELQNAYHAIMGKVNIMGNKNEKMLVEAFVVGNEYVVNSVSCNGHHKLVDIWAYRKKYIQGKTYIYDREELVDMNSAEYRDMINYVHKSLDALGIKFGPSHAEVMLTSNGPVLIEVAARLGGATNIEASQECIGIDSVSLTIDSYLNHAAFNEKMQRFNSVSKYGMVVDFATEQEGEIESETITANLIDLPSLKTSLIKLKPGELIIPTRDLLSSPAKFHLVHEDKQQLYKDYDKIQTICKNGFVIKKKNNLDCLAIVQASKLYAEPNNRFRFSYNHAANSDSCIDLGSSYELLTKLNKGWHERSRIKASQTDLSGIEFDLSREDYIEELLPFHNHPLYQCATQEMKSKILTCAWLIYNEKTVAIETQLITPCCVDIINGIVPGLAHSVFREAAAEAMVDESFHTLLVLKANEITSLHRKINLDFPQFELISKVSEYKESCKFEWQKSLITMIASGVSELFVSDYLKLLSHNNEIQKLNKLTVEAHYKDEIRHSKIFGVFLKCMYASLPQDQKVFFAETLAKPVYWFADKELNVWESVLTQIGFPHVDQVIKDAQSVQQYNLEILDTTKLDVFANSIGLSGVLLDKPKYPSTCSF
ncbi:MAG: diiron oxygenase [Pseudomonadota bacterium]|nr:diiron oxygenase [Pseudomonadota bacterium]